MKHSDYRNMADIPSVVSEEQCLVSKEPSITVWEGARFVRVDRATDKGKHPKKGVGCARGDVTGFSRSSRRRLLSMLAKIRLDALPLFVTLTYPDVFNTRFSVWKRDVDVFGKRLLRLFPLSAFVWRVEFKVRKSGEGAGFIAPHYHLLVWGVDLSFLLEWLGTIWYDVVGSGSLDHLFAGTSVEEIRSPNGTMYYVSKYIAKVDICPEGWSGRSWGLVGRKNLPLGFERKVCVKDSTASAATRLGRRFIGLKGIDLRYGLSWVMRSGAMSDWLEFRRDQFGDGILEGQ